MSGRTATRGLPQVGQVAKETKTLWSQDQIGCFLFLLKLEKHLFFSRDIVA